MKRKLTLMLIFVFLSSFSASEALQNINIVMKEGDYMPYMHAPDKGDPVGIYVDLVKEAAKKLGISASIQAYPWKRCHLMLELGKADAIIGVFKGQDTQDSMYFAEEPLAYEETALFTYKGSNIKFNGSLDDLYQYSVGKTRGVTFHDEWENKKFNFKKIEETNQLDQSIMKLAKKRVDLVIGNKFIVQYNMEKLGLTDQIVVLNPGLSLSAGHLAFSKAKGASHKALAKAFDNAIKEIKKSDKYFDILNKYADF